PGIDHGFEVEQAASVLAGGDAVAARAPHHGKTGVVLRRPNRLLQPVEAKVGELAVVAQRLLHGPGAVGVEHHDGLLTGRLAGSSDLRYRRLVQLDVLVAALDRPTRRFHYVRDVAVDHQARVHGYLVGERPAQQVDERLSGAFAEDVPQRNVDGRDAVHDRADTAQVLQVELDLELDLGDLCGVAPDDEW